MRNIRDWQVPKSVKDIQWFRGFCNFYRRFIKDFGKICKPLDRLTGNVPFEWGSAEQESFDTLVAAFGKEPVLVMWDHDKEHRMEVDSSGYAIGGVLLQKEDDQKWHPVAFISEGLNETERNYDIGDREMLAIIRGLEQWRHYLEGTPQPFEIISDHQNLKSWMVAKNLSRRQARWSLFLTRFNFIITHKPGITNLAADTLSRNPLFKKTDADDNLGQIVLTPDRFAKICATYSRGHAAVERDVDLLHRIRKSDAKDQQVVNALSEIKKLAPSTLR